MPTQKDDKKAKSSQKKIRRKKSSSSKKVSPSIEKEASAEGIVGVEVVKTQIKKLELENVVIFRMPREGSDKEFFVIQSNGKNVYVYKQNRQFHCTNGSLQSDYIRLIKEAIKQKKCKDIYCKVVYKVQPLKSGGATIERLYKLFPKKPKKKTKDNCTITFIENISEFITLPHHLEIQRRYFLNQSYF